MNPTYLFDTGILISHLRSSRASASEWILRAAQKQVPASISVLTIYELQKGAKTDRQKRDAHLIVAPFQKHPLNRQIALRAGELYRSIPKNRRTDRINIDVLIAATAEWYGCDLVTTNPADFSLIPTNRIQIIPI